jgi:hypothetical protein
MTRSPRRLSIDGVHYAVLLIREQDVRSAYVPRRAVRLLKGLDVFQTERVLPGIFQHHPQPGERFAALHRHDRAPRSWSCRWKGMDIMTYQAPFGSALIRSRYGAFAGTESASSSPTTTEARKTYIPERMNLFIMFLPYQGIFPVPQQPNPSYPCLPRMTMLPRPQNVMSNRTGITSHGTPRRSFRCYERQNLHEPSSLHYIQVRCQTRPCTLSS